MSDLTSDPDLRATLRQQAHEQLKAGIAPASRGWGVSVEALTLLHRLASTPDSAADAMKLLHELQVHQVELDLQQAQLEANERDMAEELARYRALYEYAPVAHFVLNACGRIEQCNRAGAEWLGIRRNEAEERRFDELLSADSRLPLAALLRDVRGGVVNPCRSVRRAGDPLDVSPWRITAGALPDSDAVLLVVTDGAGSPEN